ncbi:hypothetical protein DW107_09990 [Tannerella sp. AM09-19]|nr:hypothetical protein DW107_09990 [Tannerella sp. AM09-19]
MKICRKIDITNKIIQIILYFIFLIFVHNNNDKKMQEQRTAKSTKKILGSFFLFITLYNNTYIFVIETYKQMMFIDIL